MLLKVNLKFNVGIVRTNGVTRLHFYRNIYGVEFGFNIPRRFGIFMYISH